MLGEKYVMLIPKKTKLVIFFDRELSQEAMKSYREVPQVHLTYSDSLKQIAK